MKLQIGIAGAGNFARFAAKAFLEIPGIIIVAVTDINKSAVNEMSQEWQAKAYDAYELFLEDERIELVYIATPPWLHYQQSKLALLKGKHVICEKPAALKSAEAIELAALSASLDLLWMVNLMQRYNPLYAAVKAIVDEKILGDVLHGFFENYASDENLEPDHWFWDETKSGGIFIEHGVHFFDMFAGWLGKGKLIHACQLQRSQHKHQKITDRVQATVLYAGGIVNFYHAFDQPKILDRQEMRLQFENGEITLYEWVPVRMHFHGLVSQLQLVRLKQLLGAYHITNEIKNASAQTVTGRFREINFETHITFEYKDAEGKQDRYKMLLKDMIQDQWRWVKDHKHHRVINAGNAVESLLMAEAATNEAKKNTW